jgi:hypothetical protein
MDQNQPTNPHEILCRALQEVLHDFAGERTWENAFHTEPSVCRTLVHADQYVCRMTRAEYERSGEAS